MAKSQVFSKDAPSGDVSINMTPMIDCTFQLLLFFLITSSFASAAISKLVLPGPHEKQIIPEKELKVPRTIVNVLSAEDEHYRQTVMAERGAVIPGDLAWYEIRGQRINARGSSQELTRMIKAEYDTVTKAGRKDDFIVEIRADYRVSYDFVATVMQAAALAGVAKANTAVRMTPPRDDKAK